MSGKRRLDKALRNLIAEKQDKPILYPGLMGAFVAGVKSIKVAGRPDFVWIRLRGVQSEPIMAFNDKVGEHFDLPVLVFREPENPQLWRIYGRDVSKYQNWGGASYLPPHGHTHSLTSGRGAGSDIVWVQKAQFMPMLPHPDSSGSNSIYIEPSPYFWDGEYHFFPGTGTQSLMAYKPTGAFSSRFVTVYLDGNLGTLGYLYGEEYSANFPPADVFPYIAVPDPEDGFPIAAVNLFTGTERIGWREIYDLRLLPGPILNSGTFVSVLDEGVPLGLGNELNFRGDGVTVEISGSYVDIYIPGGGGGGPGGGGGIMFWEDGAPLGTGFVIDAGYGIDASLSGMVAQLQAEPPITGSVVVAEDGVIEGSATLLNFTGAGVDVAVSGSYATITITGGGGGGGGGTGTATYLLAGVAEPLDPPTNQYWRLPVYPYATGSLSVMLNGVWQKPGVDFTEQSPVSGTFALTSVPPTGTVSAASWGIAVEVGGGVTLTVLDEGVTLGPTTHLDFVGPGVQATISGTFVQVQISGGGGSGTGTATYMLAGVADPLDPPTSQFWRVPVFPYATGSLSVMLNGVWQKPGVDFTEQSPVSGTFALTSIPPTGTVSAASWGIPVDSGAGGGHETGTVVVYDEGTFVGVFEELHFIGAGVEVGNSGSYGAVTISGGGGGHETGTVVVYDEDTFVGVFEEVRFIGAGVNVQNSGSYAAVGIPGGGGNPTGIFIVEQMLFETVITTPIGFVNVTGVPTTYDHLGWRIKARTDRAGSDNEGIDLFLNGDTGSTNYRNGGQFGGTAGGVFAADGAFIGSVPASTAAAELFGINSGEIPDYTITGSFTQYLAIGGERRTTTVVTWISTVNWEKHEVVNQMRFSPTNGNQFVSGTHVQVWGIGQRALSVPA